MKSFVYSNYLFLLSLLTSTVWGQIPFDTETNSIHWPESGGAFCVGGHMDTSAFANCTGHGEFDVYDCNEILTGLEPLGKKNDSLCHQISENHGDAGCHWHGTVYELEQIDGVFTVAPQLADNVPITASSAEGCKAPIPTNTNRGASTRTPLGATTVTFANLTTITKTIPYPKSTEVSNNMPTSTSTGMVTAPESTDIPKDTQITSAATSTIEEAPTSADEEVISHDSTTTIPRSRSTKVVVVFAEKTSASGTTHTKTATSEGPIMPNTSVHDRSRLDFVAIALSTLAAVMVTLL